LIGNSARHTAVSIVERVDGHEPEMGHAGAQESFRLGSAVEPVEEACHLGVELIRGRRLIMDALPADRPRDHLHRTGRIVAPCAGPDPTQT
jgi:hypothetical protein